MATFRIPKQKVILCGDYGVGKSSLFRRFVNNTFVSSSDRKSTLGLDHIDKEYQIDDKQIKMQLWDTGGMERIASVTSSYYKFAKGAILVFALDNATSFYSLSQHVLDVVAYAENAKIFICGNKQDLKGNATEVDDAEIEAFCDQCHTIISAKYKTSCKTGEGVEEMFSDISRILLEANRTKFDLQANIEQQGFHLEAISAANEAEEDNRCVC